MYHKLYLLNTLIFVLVVFQVNAIKLNLSSNKLLAN